MSIEKNILLLSLGPFRPLVPESYEGQTGLEVSSLSECPHQLSSVFDLSFFPPPPGYFPLSPGNIFFFPPYDSYRGASTEASRRGGAAATMIFLPPPASAGSDALPRRHPSSGDDALRAIDPF